jgi:hypothetical protein
MMNKQAFLRKEILEAGVDPSEFLEFMSVADRNKGTKAATSNGGR